MNSVINPIVKCIAVLLLVMGAVGCDAFEDRFEDEKEVTGLVEEVGADYLVVEAIRYEVTANTEFEGITGLADLAVGDEVEVEYEENGDTRVALEIEFGDED